MFESELQTKAAQFHALAGELAAAVSADTSGRLAVELLPEVLAGVRQGELATCRLIERADRTGEYSGDGAASVTAYVRQLSGERGPWASARVQVGRALVDQLPATAAAWEKGQLGLAHAIVIDRATKRVSDPDLIVQLDAFLADMAMDHSPSELATAAEHLLAQAAPEETETETAAKRAAQKLCLSQTLDGMWRLDAWLDAESGGVVSNAIAAFLRKPDPDGDVVTESVGRRRADALVQMSRHALAHAESCGDKSGGGRHTIVVGIDHQSLLDGYGTGRTLDGGSLPAATVRRMACDADIIPAVYGSESEVLDYGRRARVVRNGLSLALAARDGGCIFPACDRPASWTEAHHRKSFLDGGTTDKENLDLLCVFHHHFVHEKRWQITIGDDPGRTPWFHPPDGRPPMRGQRRPLLRKGFPKPRAASDGRPCRT